MGFITMDNDWLYFSPAERRATQRSLENEMNRSICKDCGKQESSDLMVSECRKCGEPVCGDCAEVDYDMVGDPLHYVCCQWDCQPCLHPEAFLTGTEKAEAA